MSYYRAFQVAIIHTIHSHTNIYIHTNIHMHTYIFVYVCICMGFLGGSVVKNSPANAGASGSIPGSGRSLEGAKDNSLQYSCLGNPMDRGAWWATVHSIAESQTRLKRLSPHTHACSTMEGPRQCHTEWSKSDREEKYVISIIWET